MAPNKHPFPPSLSNIESDYQRLCDDLGGPAEIGIRVERRMLERYCQDYPLREVLPSLMLFQHDEAKARRYWPWAAAALGVYKFEHNERKKYADEPSPKKIVELLNQIGQSAHTLVAALCRLEDLSNRLDDPTAPDRRDHIAQLNQIISRAAIGRLLSDTNEDDDALLTQHFEKEGFLNLLSDVEIAAGEAKKQADSALLHRERPSIPGLRNFILICSKIWIDLTGRESSAYRVYPGHKAPDPDKDPDFVAFVRALAGVATSHLPTRDQIFLCLQQSKRRAITTKNSS